MLHIYRYLYNMCIGVWKSLSRPIKLKLAWLGGTETFKSKKYASMLSTAVLFAI